MCAITGPVAAALSQPELHEMRTRRFFVLFSLGATTFFLAGCATPSGETATEEHAPPANAVYRTFAVEPVETAGPATDPSAGARLSQPAQEAAVATMLAKKYRQASLQDADLLVRLIGEFAPDMLTELSERRKLTIEILDNRSKKVIWSNFRARSSVRSASVEEVRAIVEQILAPFPVAPH